MHSFSQVSLVVNVASLCGFTDTTYRGLKRLQDILGYGKRFQVLAFPCNQFGDQEPYDNDIIQQFATTNYAVEFPMFSKVDVIGEEAHPAFKNLISKKTNVFTFDFISKNFFFIWTTQVSLLSILSGISTNISLVLMAMSSRHGAPRHPLMTFLMKLKELLMLSHSRRLKMLYQLPRNQYLNLNLSPKLPVMTRMSFRWFLWPRGSATR